MTAVAYDRGSLSVTFANGDVVDLDPTWLAPSGLGSIDWSGATLDGPEIQAPLGGRIHAVSWLDVRALTDESFATYLAQVADEEARRVGQKLRRLREARGLSSASLAVRARLTPQSLSRIELGRHDVVYSTLQRLLAAMNYSLRDLEEAPEEEIEPAQVARRLAQAGLSKELVARLVPSGARTSQTLDRLFRIFGWSATDLAANAELPIRASVAAVAAFKATTAQHPAQGPYVLYAHYLAALAHQAAPARTVELPRDAQLVRDEVLAKADLVDFESLLDWAWGQGVVVLPLFDPGHFHGACWLFDGRPVIVLKQVTKFSARLAFDLGHEIGHASLHLSGESPAVIETGEISLDDDEDDEWEASDFAGTAILGDPEALAAKVVARAQGHAEWLRRAVLELAPKERVAVGALANFLAWRLAASGEVDWWGPAANLQEPSERPAQAAVEALLAHLDLERLADDDRALLLDALGVH